MNKNNRTYTDEEVIRAISENITIADALRDLGLKITGGNYKTIKTLIVKLNIDTSHVLGKKRLKGKKCNDLFKKKPLSEILVKNSKYRSVSLKKRLISEGLLKNKCSRCEILNWQGELLSLHMDHINGDPSDNRLCNLRLLCPNCHSLTPTYCGRNIKVGRKVKYIKPIPTPKLCIDCNKEIDRKATRCKSCAGKYHQPTKTTWPPIDQLIKMVEETNYSAVGKKLGVSDNAVRKRIKKHTK